MVRLLNESEHRQYLDMFLKLVEDLRSLGHETIIPRYVHYIQDVLEIARSVGYGRLADEYTGLFKRKGVPL